jgi:hypothetical protein
MVWKGNGVHQLETLIRSPSREYQGMCRKTAQKATDYGRQIAASPAIDHDLASPVLGMYRLHYSLA